jgi:hypothetical protein
MPDQVSQVQVQMDAETFLRFVQERIGLHGGANIMVLLECHDGPFETLCSVPSGAWQRGMLETARDMLVERTRPTTHQQMVRHLESDDGGTVN